MLARLRHFLRDSRGGAALEAAVVLPVALAMIAGISEYSRVLIAQHMVREIIDTAARTGALTGLTQAQIEAQIDAAIDAIPGLQDYTLDVDVGTSVDVSVTCTFDVVFGDYLPYDAITFTFATRYGVL